MTPHTTRHFHLFMRNCPFEIRDDRADEERHFAEGGVGLALEKVGNALAKFEQIKLCNTKYEFVILIVKSLFRHKVLKF